ncbi:MAG: hypothetical protein A3E01_00015 [Gammaproteobacteria bacterium RIFCSPHIGHO2_12_FULL_63_22]|nr:MAG: hypothetical protein A3E01_00015 [Gammaproteobacteria bacterium RIFCSPHIGHO2_12_FULL_63_22]
MSYINNGRPTDIWHGITARMLLERAGQARGLGMTDEADSMAYVASLMHAAEPILAPDFAGAEQSMWAVERRLVADFVGPAHPADICHPALA